MTLSKTICPMTKKEFPIDIHMPGPQFAMASRGEIVGYTLTLAKCPECGGTHAWECSGANDLLGTLATVRTVAAPTRQALQHGPQHT